jgi:dephospho-CoA kinase
MAEKIKIGITGGIGGGKSTVAEIFRKNGITVFDADQVAKDLMTNDEEIRSAIIELFGEDAYIDGELNTKLIAEMIFNNPDLKEGLEEIVHPAVIAELGLLMESELKEKDIVAVESALLFEAKMPKLFDYIFAVTADEETRIKRVMERDGVTEEEVRKRMESQMPENEKAGKSDFVFENNGDLKQLVENVVFILNLIKRIPKPQEEFEQQPQV